MLRLTTFGGLALESSVRDIAGAAQQRRRLALLAVLAVAGPRGRTRDKLLGLLWPEINEARGRSALSQALYALRRDTGVDDLVRGNETLCLHPEAIASDVGEFEAALASHDRERLAVLYTAPFLDGVYLADAPGFDHWVDAQRLHFAEATERALEQLAAEADARSDHGAAARWWQRFTALDPLRTRGAIGLMSALAAHGDRPGALRHAETYARLVREELDAEPSANVQALAERVRGEVSARTFAERFVVERELGRGGMAVVFLALDRRHDRHVALKMLHPEIGAAVGRERLQREILVTAKLQHPHIVPLHDSGESDGTLYYVMPFVEGESLRARMTRESCIPLAEALALTREVAEALDYAHRRGVIHRDIKPENILLSDGHAMVTDFGIARVVTSTLHEHITQAGVSVGTPAYMSPEQVAGDPDLGPASDIFSLGCVLFEMIAGRPPWIAANTQALLARRFTHTAPPLWTIDKDVPRWLAELVQHMLAADPASRPSTAAEVAQRLSGAAPPAPSQLPAHGELLVGREREVATARALVERPDVALVTLTGSGGSGKTRLAVQLAIELEQHTDRVYFVDLSALRETAGLLPAIAETIGAHGGADHDALPRLAAVLSAQRTLLVLDNFEQIVAAASVLGRLIDAAPSLKVLVTSRVRLGIRSEHEFFVSPLGTPEDVATADASVLRRNPAVQLFVQRAATANPRLALDDDAVRAIARICVRVDGLPLAIELAAARCRLMTPGAVLARVDKGFEVLAGGRRDAPERQQTMRQTIAWSRDLLSGSEQALFARMAVFAGGCTLEAAEGICLGEENGDVLAGIEALVDASLLMRDTTTDAAAEPRLRMLETVREFARDALLHQHDAATVHGRHRDWYLRLAESLAPLLTGVQQEDAVAVFVLEHANLRAALAWSMERGHVMESLHLGASLWRFWLIRGHLGEGSEWLDRILAMETPGSQMAARATVLIGAGHLAQNHAAVDAATEHFAAALDIRRTLGDQHGVAQGLADLGWMGWRRCDYPKARQLSQESLALAESLGDTRVVALALSNLGFTALFEGNLDEARAVLERSLHLRVELSDRRGVAFAQTVLGWTLCRADDLAGAQRLLGSAIETYRSIGDERLYDFALDILVEVLLRGGATELAAENLDRESLPSLRRIGDRWSLAHALALRSWAACASGDVALAAVTATESLALRRADGDLHGIAASLALLAEVAILEHRTSDALPLLQESRAMRSAIGDRRGVAECDELLATLPISA